MPPSPARRPRRIARPSGVGGALLLLACLGLLGIVPALRPAPAPAGARQAGPAPAPRPAQARYPVTQQLAVAYHDASPRQRLDLFLPQLPGGQSPPVLVFAPAGAWAAGDRTVYRPQAFALAELGLGVALVDHRISDGGPGGVRHPEHARDLARACAFLRTWLLVNGLDPGGIFVGGHEAGAHLGALLAADPRLLAEQGLSPADLRGVIGLGGIYRIVPDDGSWAEVFGLDPLTRGEASPHSHLRPGTPPMLLMAADGDTAARRADAAGLAEALIQAGSLGDAPVIEGRSPESLLTFLGQPADEATDLLLQFVRQRMAARPRPTATPTATPSPTPSPTPVDAAPPGLPPRGPGSARRAIYERALLEPRQVGDLAWWRMVPAGAAAEDPLLSAPLPVLVFLPSAEAAATDPIAAYRRWLEHLALAGTVVLIPGYGSGPVAGLPARLEQTLPAALAELRADPDWARRIDREVLYWAGHLEGGALAVALAADWFGLSLPLPRGLFLLQPRDAAAWVAGPDLRRLPADLLALTVAAEEDPAPDIALEELLWDRMAHVPSLWRERLVLRSDRYGRPGLHADHRAAYSDAPLGELDGLDGYGGWKWLDALLACGQLGTDCGYAFGGGPEQLGMGAWADGHPARPALRSAGPPRRYPWRGLLPWIGKRAE